jgi:hypothetical protein
MAGARCEEVCEWPPAIMYLHKLHWEGKFRRGKYSCNCRSKCNALIECSLSCDKTGRVVVSHVSTALMTMSYASTV